MRAPDRLSPSEAIALKIQPIPHAPQALFALREDAAPRRAPGDPCGDDGAAGGKNPRRGWRQFALTGGALALLWGGLTGWDAASWVFGAPAVLAATALSFCLAPAPAWRLSVPGAIRFAGWFAVNSLRAALTVTGRALAWRIALTPGFRSYRTSLPPGAARICFANVITLLPGTLSVQIDGDLLEVHMLDTGGDLEAELGEVEARIRDLFALPAPGEAPQHSRAAAAQPMPAKLEDIA